MPEVVIGDPGRFRQIITNLVGNSIKVSYTWDSKVCHYILGILWYTHLFLLLVLKLCYWLNNFSVNFLF